MINPVDNKPFSVSDADRLLGLADQFIEDWEQHEGQGDPECIERRIEYDAIRPLLASAPALYHALVACLKYIEDSRYGVEIVHCADEARAALEIARGET